MEQILRNKIHLEDDARKYIIMIRKRDLFLDATALISSVGKYLANWTRTLTAKKCIKEWAKHLGKPVEEIMVKKKNKHTWMCKEIFLELAGWINSDLRPQIEQIIIKSANRFVSNEEWEKKSQITEKRCNVCKKIKPVEEFSKNKRINNGYARACKACDNDYRDKHREHINQKAREWFQNNKERATANKRKWSQKNRDKVNARNREYTRKETIIKGTDEKEYKLVLMQNEEGYVDGSQLCSDNNKRIQNWLPTQRTQKLLEKIAIRTGVSKKDLVKKEKVDNKHRIYWLHPQVALAVAKWISAELEIELKNAIQESVAEQKEEEKTEMILFEFEGQKLTIISNESGDPWFVAKQIASILGYKDTPKAIKRHIDSEDRIHLRNLKLGVMTHPQKSLNIQSTMINESGLYSLVLSSKLPKARKFKRWVTSEVLPTIRKQGRYKLLKRIEEKSKEIEKLEKKYNTTLKRQKPEINLPEGTLIYVMAHREFPRQYKIGITNDLANRFNTYNTHSPENFCIIYHHVTKYAKKIETAIKLILSDKLSKANKEWFELKNPDILINLIKNISNSCT